MQIKNLDAARRLVKKYRSITREELESNAHEDDDYWHEALSRITGFGVLEIAVYATNAVMRLETQIALGVYILGTRIM